MSTGKIKIKNYKQIVSSEGCKEIIDLLNNLKNSREIVQFLKENEPVLCDEVNTAINHNRDYLESLLPPEIMGLLEITFASLMIMGFLLCLEGTVPDWQEQFKLNTDNMEINQEKVDKAIDKLLSNGKNHQEIGRIMKSLFKTKKRSFLKRKDGGYE